MYARSVPSDLFSCSTTTRFDMGFQRLLHHVFFAQKNNPLCTFIDLFGLNDANKKLIGEIIMLPFQVKEIIDLLSTLIYGCHS